MDASDKETFLTICTNRIQDLYSAAENDVECIDVTANADVTSMIDVTLGSNNGASMISAVTGLILTDGIDMISFGDYVLFEDLVTFSVTYVNDYDAWKGTTSDSEMALFGALCSVTIAGAQDGDYMCSEPVADPDTNQVVITYTVPSSEQSAVTVMVSGPNFTVGAFNSLEAVADPSTCEKIDQADVVIWFNNDGTQFQSYEANTCFAEMTTTVAYEDRTKIDELAGFNLQTVIGVFADGSTQTNEMAAYVTSLGYVHVLNAESYAAVASARDGNGCNCFFEQESEVVVMDVDSYDIEIGGLVVGVVGVLLFFGLCLVCVFYRDAWFSDAEEVKKIMNQQNDVLDRIKQKEESATSEKVLPEWKSGGYTPGSKYFEKEECKVRSKLTEKFDKSMMAAQETQEMV